MDSFLQLTVSVPKDTDLAHLLAERVELLTQSRVLVGVPEQTAGRKASAVGGVGVGPLDESPSGGENIEDNNAAIGYIQNFGAPELRIPPRPFLVPGVKNALELLTSIFRKVAKDALNGNFAAVDIGLHKVGLICQNQVRRKLTEGPFLPLSPVTVAMRAAKHNRKKPSLADYVPLIDTGRLRQSITYAIELKGTTSFVQPITGTSMFSKVIN